MTTKVASWDGKIRLALAALLVLLGTVVIGPSFDFDSDDDGVADSIEVYELGTDPAKADARFNRGFARRATND